MCTCNLAPQPCKSCQDHWADNRPELQPAPAPLDIFDLVMQALDLAQDLSMESELRNPRFLRLRFKASRKRLFETLLEKHDYIRHMTKQAYDLVEALSAHAETQRFPSERELIATKLEHTAASWRRPKSFSYPAALRELAADIRAGK